MKLETLECDGCGKRTTLRSEDRYREGWRALTVHFATFGRQEGTMTHRRFDVCPDPLCAARVVDATRDRPALELVREDRRA